MDGASFEASTPDPIFVACSKERNFFCEPPKLQPNFAPLPLPYPHFCLPGENEATPLELCKRATEEEEEEVIKMRREEAAGGEGGYLTRGNGGRVE